MNSISIIIPVFNEAENLINFNNNLDDVLKKLIKYKFNKIFIDDGSIDDSRNKITEIIKNDNNSKLISFTKNFGHQSAIKAGLTSIESDYYLVLDSDMQHDPSLIELMVNTVINPQIDIVQMKKNYGKYEGILKRLLSIFFYRIFKSFTDVDLQKGSSDFYIISKRVRDQIIGSNYSNNFIRGFIHWSGFNKVYLDYLPQKRKYGKSSYNFIKQLDLAITGIYYYTSKIYLYTFILSFILFIISISYIIFIIYKYLSGNIPPGWSELAILNLFFGSTILLLISILIFLVTKIFTIISKKPEYIIKNISESKKDE